MYHLVKDFIKVRMDHSSANEQLLWTKLSVLKNADISHHLVFVVGIYRKNLKTFYTSSQPIVLIAHVTSNAT